MGPFCVLDSVYVGRAKQILCAAGARMLGKSAENRKKWLKIYSQEALSIFGGSHSDFMTSTLVRSQNLRNQPALDKGGLTHSVQFKVFEGIVTA